MYNPLLEVSLGVAAIISIVLPTCYLLPNARRFAARPAALASLSMRYPLRDRKSFRKTAVMISALAHWSAILAEVEFAPSWCYPFVVVFSQVGVR